MGDERRVLDVEGLDLLVHELRNRGYTVIGPTIHGDAIVHAEVRGVADLPRGCGDDQEAGRYRLRRRGDDALFGYAVGAQSWKQVLFPSRLLLWQAHRSPDGAVELEPADPEPPRYAMLGVRACDLAAIAIQDRVLAGRRSIDPDYAERRTRSFIVAVGCSDPARTCFCTSMGTGPCPQSGYDLSLTEILSGRHRFLVQVGTPAGREVLAAVPTVAAEEADVHAAEAVVAESADRIERRLDTTDISQLLYRNAEHPQWDEVAKRCLACANCTLVCPTCFCTDVEDVGDLTGETSGRWRVWDSCFTSDFSHLHGGSVRETPRSRYRQWATHKLASWIDQFGTSGCVGCGRCIAWCPVGIDITAEVSEIRASDGQTRTAGVP